MQKKIPAAQKNAPGTLSFYIKTTILCYSSETRPDSFITMIDLHPEQRNLPALEALSCLLHEGQFTSRGNTELCWKFGWK